MLRGVAKAEASDTAEDRYAIVVALSQLSRTLSGADTGSAFDAAAATAATLLRVRMAAVFLLQRTGDELVAAGSVGMEDSGALVAGAREIAQAALASSAPLIKTNLSAELSSTAKALSRAGAASAISVPLRVGETNLGAIVALSEDLRAFSHPDVEILHVVASQAALVAWRLNPPDPSRTAAEDDELVRLADRKIKELSLLNQVSEAMSSTLDLDKLLDIALEQSMAAVGADGGSLMLVSEETSRLEIAASRGLAQRWVETTAQAVGTSIAGWVAEHGQSVLVKNAHTDPRFSMPFFRDDIASAASVPLKAKGTVIGVLNVNTVQPDKSFDERDLQILGTVANEMAVAIENARLYARVNRRTKQLDSLLEISKTVTSTLNLDEVLRRLADEVCKLFQLDVCVLLLADEISGRLRFGYGSGLKSRRKYAYYDLAAPIASRVKRSGRKLVMRDISASSRLSSKVSEAEEIKGAVCIPLKNEGKVVGVAAGFTREARVFPRSQLEIMRPLGELGGVAIRNATVYRRKYKMAELLQQRLLPTEAPRFAGLDVGHKFLPAREVGGDYYDFIVLGPQTVGVVVADVSGSDVEAAEYTTMGKHVLRAYAREGRGPAEVLAKTNGLVCEDIRSEMFISLFYGVIDLGTMTLTYANAGCEPPILYKARSGEVSALVADGMLLGIDKGAVYEEREIKLANGDALAIYTDGLTESSLGREKFGAARAMEILSASAGLGAQAIADRMHDVLLEFVHGRITDDVAMVVVKADLDDSR